MQTLFDIKEFETKLHDLDGKFCSKSHKRDINRLRTSFVAFIRQRDSVYRQLRAKDEEIIRLKAILKAKFQTFEEYDRMANLF